jgi:hypothetical protein
MIKSTSKSIRKILGEALAAAADNVFAMTGKSINALPEYFLSVKVAEYLHGQLKTFTFSMEDSISDMAKEIGMNISAEPDCFRLNGKADLILRGQVRKKLKHVVEFKRNLGLKGIEHDALRLAWFCANTPEGHRAERNFLVAVTHKPKSLFKTRTLEIEELIFDKFGGNIKVIFDPVDLPSLKSTHKKGLGNDLFGGVWEFRYVDTGN